MVQRRGVKHPPANRVWVFFHNKKGIRAREEPEAKRKKAYQRRKDLVRVQIRRTSWEKEITSSGTPQYANSAAMHWGKSLDQREIKIDCLEGGQKDVT